MVSLGKQSTTSGFSRSMLVYLRAKSNQIPYGLSTADCDAHPAFGQWQGAQHQRGTHQGSQQDPAPR